MKKLCLLFTTAVLATLTGSFTAADSQAPRRQKTQPPTGYYLPKAGFPVLTGGGGSSAGGSMSGGGGGPLPMVNGLHLQDGEDRRPGEGMQAYDPGPAAVCWDRRKFPIKVWISPGQQLPPMPLKVAEDARPMLMHNMLQDPNTFGKFEDLPTCKGFRSEMCDTVAEGIEAWRDMHNEGTIRFGFVDRPQDADVLVFFTDSFPDSTGPGGNRVGAHTTGKAYTAQQVSILSQQNQARVPVVMEFNVNEELQQMQGTAAHEFGHALGITDHSPYRDDLMYLYRIVSTPSPADKATLRNLYRNPPKLWRY